MGTPLFVIDGIIKDEAQFNNLDVNDIENISILKDGAAAIYGVNKQEWSRTGYYKKWF